MKITSALLAAAATALVAAPPAHAGWMTGNGNPPIYTTDAPCRNGMQWSYATFVPGAWPPAAPALDIHFHAVVLDSGMPPQDPPNFADVVSFAPTYTIPRRTLQLPPTFTMIGASLYPGPVNRFDYSRDFTFAFNRTLPWGAPLRIQWHDWAGNTVFAAARYRVASCWIGTVLSRYTVAVRGEGLEPSTLRLDGAVPRKWYRDGEQTILVFDELRYELGERVVLSER